MGNERQHGAMGNEWQHGFAGGPLECVVTRGPVAGPAMLHHPVETEGGGRHPRGLDAVARV